MAESIWVGKDEHEGVPAQPRKDLEPPPHWRLDAIAQTPRPHSLSAREGKAVFIEAAAETSDVWLLDLEAGGPPERLTTGRDPVPYWADTAPRLSPDGSTVAYADGDHVWLVATAGGAPRQPVQGGGAVWGDAARAGAPAGRPAAKAGGGGRADVDRRRAADRRGRARRHDAPGGGRRRRRVAATPRGRARRTRRPRRRGRARRLPRRHRGRLYLHAAGRPQPQERDPGRRPRRRRGARGQRGRGHARQQPDVVAGWHDHRLRVRAQRLLRAAPRRRRGPPADERGRRPPRARLAPGRDAPGRRARAAQPVRPRR